MREAMDINNTRPIHDIVKDTLREARNKEWDFNEFIVMGTWRPKKKNLCNNRFMKRMRERNERIPDPGEQFSYVVVKGSRLRKENGTLIPYRVGDYMEYPHIAKEQNIEIDINYYLLTTVAIKGGELIHIGWLFACTMAQAKKILINLPKVLSEKVLAHIQKRFKEVLLAPVLIR
ncbi:hypothetical protein RhiirC2_800705 [Rhizophagus irregularis]|uniref:DNA-directed DNA polymerase n=1 Tax=Rhizophagus irregularis TaxID=588596 RepID=A0A2N1M3B0_9GLOM|nr:hypothetical protein RhiirC2_800705 [Rhizophagus irregularis]